MAIMYEEPIDAIGKRQSRVAVAASNAAKSAQRALQTTRSFTYLALSSPLFAVGFCTQLATAFSIELLEQQLEIGKQLTDILVKPPTKASPEEAKHVAAHQTIAATARGLAMAADDAIQAAHKAIDDADQAAVRKTIDDAEQELVTAANDAAKAIVVLADDVERAIVPAADDVAPAPVTTTDEDQEIELRAERLVINMERRQNGEARVRKEIVTEVKSIDVPVSHEELVIERYAFTGDADVDSEPIADETIRIPLTEEKVNISKETVVREEVELGIRRVDDVEHISETVRHEELHVG